MALSRKSGIGLVLLVAAALGAVPLNVWADASASQPSQIADVRVGLANHYKVGYWTPVWVDVTGSAPAEGARVEVTVPDSDGVETMASVPLPPQTSAGSTRTAVVYTKVGRIGAPIRVALVNDEDEPLDEKQISASAAMPAGATLIELPANGELLIALGSASFGLIEAFPDRDAPSGEFARRTIQVPRVADLPTDWLGYEAVDVLVISGSDAAQCRELVADEARYAALVRWIELGGRLVVMCGGDAGKELLTEGGALAGLVPGKLNAVVRLSETGPLEHFAEPATTIAAPGSGAALEVPQLIDVEGKIEAYAGRRPTDLPLVIRAARGLGEVAFAGVDFTAPPLAGWPGRGTFLQALLRPYVPSGQLEDAPQTLVTLGYNDLSGALRQRLGRSFAGVVPFGIPTVAALAVAYLLVLGPLDYFVVHRWLRRPLAAWITFPIIVMAFGFGGLTLAEWRKGAGTDRLNCLELVDVDAITEQARGTFWSTVYSPEAMQFDFSVDVDSAAEPTAGARELLLSWWGLPGVGIGGMQAGGSNLGIVRDAYRYSADRAALEGVPLLASSTKSLVARWTAQAGAAVDAQLTDMDGFATGSIVNRTGQSLRDVRLFYGSWGYRLGDLSDGQQIDVGEHLDPLSVKTIVTRSALGGDGSTAEDRERIFSAEQATALELLNAMMFYEAAGGLGFAHLPHRYQAYCDLSRHLVLGRAILVAEADGPGSRLFDSVTGEVIGDERRDGAVIYRFVLPVEKANN